MILGEKGTIVESRMLCRNHVRMRLRSPGIAAKGLPGQFVNVRCTPMDFPDRICDGSDTRAKEIGRGARPAATLLMRPFAIHRSWTTGKNAGEIEILFKIVGRGTEALAGRKPGETLDLLGPLGKGFDLDWCRGLSTAVVVAGGAGVAPLFALAEFLRNHHVRTLVIVGAMSEKDLPLEAADSRVTLSFMEARPEATITAQEFLALGCEVCIVVMQGKKGYVGLPTDALDRFLHSTDGGARGAAGVFTCGPWGMMREVARHAAEHDVRCQALLEERMGCGIGACNACSCRVRSESGAAVRKRVCIEGPVFDASEVLWDEK